MNKQERDNRGNQYEFILQFLYQLMVFFRLKKDLVAENGLAQLSYQEELARIRERFSQEGIAKAYYILTSTIVEIRKSRQSRPTRFPYHWIINKNGDTETFSKEIIRAGGYTGRLEFRVVSNPAEDTTSITVSLQSPVKVKPSVVIFAATIQVTRSWENNREIYRIDQLQSQENNLTPVQDVPIATRKWTVESDLPKNDHELQQLVELILQHEENPKAWYDPWLQHQAQQLKTTVQGEQAIIDIVSRKNN